MAPVGRVIGQSCADSDLAVRKTTTLAFRRISMRDRMLFLAMAAVSWIALGEPALAQQVSDTVAPGAVERSLERRLPQVGEDRVNIPPPQGFEAPPGATVSETCWARAGSPRAIQDTAAIAKKSMRSRIEMRRNAKVVVLRTARSESAQDCPITRPTGAICGPPRTTSAVLPS